MSRVLIVYYSRTGTVRRAAAQLRQITGWEIAEVRDHRPRAGLGGDLRCVFDALFGRCAPYAYDGPAMGGFDRLVVLAPIWLDGLASPMRAWLRSADRPDRRVSLVCVMARHGAFRAADEVTTILGEAPEPVVALAQSEVLDGRCAAALASLAATITALDAERAAVRSIGRSSAVV